MKFLAFADLHLGAGTSLGRELGARLHDQDAVLKHILGRAIEHGVDAILIAGDVFDGPIVTTEQMDVFANFIEACDDRGIPIVATVGNSTHDSAMRTVNGLAIFDRLPGITVYSRPGLHDLGPVQVACLPWVSPSRLVARYGGSHIPRDRVNAEAAHLIVKAAAEIADPRIKPTVLLMHGSLSGASLPTGISTDDLREPVVDTDALLDLGFVAVVAGHIHEPQFVTSGSGWNMPDPDFATPFPFAFYTGSPLPLNFGEAHVPHGCWLLDVTADKMMRAEFVPIESRPFRQFGWIPDSGLVSSFPPQLMLDDVDGAIVKVKITVTPYQQRRLEMAVVRNALLDAGAHSVKIDVETVREDRARVERVTDELAPLDAFDLWAEANGPGDNGLVVSAREQMQADLEAVA